MDELKKVLFFENYGIKLLFITDATPDELQEVANKVIEDIENDTTKDFGDYFEDIDRLYQYLCDTERSGLYANDYIDLIGYDYSYNID